MANDFSSMITFMLLAMDKVSRELIGFIPAVSRNTSAERAAKGQNISYPIVGAIAGEDFAASQLPIDSGFQTTGLGTMTISKSRSFPVNITGEETKGLGTTGQYEQVMTDRFAQAMRAAVNEIEVDLGLLYKKASRAYGTAGTTPFASTFADAAAVSKILDDNGCPKTDRSLVVDTSAGLNIRSLSNYMNAAAAGGNEMRQGVLVPLYGLDIRESAQVASHVAGAGTGYDYAVAGEAIGQTTLTLEGGTVNTTGFKAGDVITQAGDTNKYIVNTGLTASSGDLVIAKPGLLVAGLDATEITIGSSYKANLLFHRDAVQLVTRAPAMPAGGDAATDSFVLTDPLSGLAFDVRLYKGHGMVKYEVCIAWGCDIVKSEWASLLLG